MNRIYKKKLLNASYKYLQICVAKSDSSFKIKLFNKEKFKSIKY